MGGSRSPRSRWKKGPRRLTFAATAERATGKNVASVIAQWDAKLEPRRLLFRGAMLHERASNASELRAALDAWAEEYPSPVS